MKNQPILILGIGIFFWAFAATFGFLFQNTARELLMNVHGVSPLVNLLICEIIYIGMIIILFLILISILKTRKLKLTTLLFLLIALIVIGQFLQFLLPTLFSSFRGEFYYDNSSTYYQYLGSNFLMQILTIVFNFLLYGLLGGIIYLNRDIIIEADSLSKSIDEIGPGPQDL